MFEDDEPRKGEGFPVTSGEMAKKYWSVHVGDFEQLRCVSRGRVYPGLTELSAERVFVRADHKFRGVCRADKSLVSAELCDSKDYAVAGVLGLILPQVEKLQVALAQASYLLCCERDPVM